MIAYDGEFLALLGAVEKIEIDQILVREAGVVGQKRARYVVALPCDLPKYHDRDAVAAV
jgi:hypothetical protein